MVMEALRRVFRRVKNFKRSGGSEGEHLTQEEKFRRCLQPYQRYFYKAQDIVIWENPSESILTIVIANVLFWLIYRSELRFYSLVFTFALGIAVQEFWEKHLWPEIHIVSKKPVFAKEMRDEEPLPPAEGRLTVPELSKYASSFWSSISEQWERMKALRETQPIIFCGVMSVSFLVLAGIGRLVSGLGLLYVIAMGMLLIPGLYIHLIPTESKKHVATCINTVRSLVKPSESSVDVEEYLPESSKENMEVFALAGDVNTESNGSSSMSMDECLVGSVMPSHEDSSMDTLDSLSLDPTVPVIKGDGGSSDTDSETDSALRFKNTHFNGSSSSSSLAEEDKLTKNLSFPDIEQVAPSPQTGLAEAITKNLSKLSGNINILSLLNTQLQAQMPQPAPQGDSSDSEFEIIESDDVS